MRQCVRLNDELFAEAQGAKLTPSITYSSMFKISPKYNSTLATPEAYIFAHRGLQL